VVLLYFIKDSLRGREEIAHFPLLMFKMVGVFIDLVPTAGEQFHVVFSPKETPIHPRKDESLTR
jgi:hypothetical protein